MTPPPATPRPPAKAEAKLLPLDDQPAYPPTTLEADLVAHTLAAQARALATMLGGHVPAQRIPMHLGERLLLPGRGGLLHLHAGRLARLLEVLVQAADVSGADAEALRAALALALGTQATTAKSYVGADFAALLAPLAPYLVGGESAGSALAVKARAAVGHRRLSPTADGLLEAVARLGTPQHAAYCLGAALHLLWLEREVRGLLGPSSHVALDLLGGLGGGAGKHLSATAEGHLATFQPTRRGRPPAWATALAGARASQQGLSRSRLQVAEARAAALALAEHAVAPLGLAWPTVKHLTVSELVAALDGAADPTALRAVAQARALHAPLPDLWALAPASSGPASTTSPSTTSISTALASDRSSNRGNLGQQQGTPLAGGIREGRICRRHLLERRPTRGEVALVPSGEPQPAWLAEAEAVITAGASPLSALAAQARDLGQGAVCLPGALGWLEEGDLVRVSGASGAVQLLERADPVGGKSGAALPVFDLRANTPPDFSVWEGGTLDKASAGPAPTAAGVPANTEATELPKGGGA